MYISRFILFFIFSLSSTSILADSHKHEHHDDEEDLFEEHTSHVHGHASAQISYVQGILNINKTLSSIDIFGFEHAPKNEEQNKIITQAINTMENAENLFSFKNNACELESFRIDNEIIQPDVDTSQNHHDHEDEHHHEEESHTDVVANYIFKCDNKIFESIEYLVFDHFPSLEEMEVEYIASDHQALFNATPSNRIQKLN